MKKNLFSIIFKCIFIVGCLLGIILNLIDSRSIISTLSYYTIISNIICLVFVSTTLVLELLNKNYESEIYHNLRGMVLGCITITFLVYYIVLAPTFDMTGAGFKIVFSNLLVHCFTPLMFWADYLIFDKKPTFGWTNPTGWLAIPILYVAYVYIYALLGGVYYTGNGLGDVAKFPYFFLNIDKIGLGNVCLWILGGFFGMLVLFYIIVALDHLFAVWGAWLKSSPAERKDKTYKEKLKPEEMQVTMGLPKDDGINEK